MEISIDHIQGFITGAFVPIILFIIKNFFIDKGNLDIEVREFQIFAQEKGGWGEIITTPISELDEGKASVILSLNLLLSNKGKRKLSIHTIKVINPKLKQQLILSNNIIEISDGESKIHPFKLEIGSKSANFLLESDSKLITVDNRGNKKKVKLNKASV